MDCYYTHVSETRPSIDVQMARIRRGAAEIVVETELRGKLERSARTGSPLLVKLGLDPTAPDLHLGHTVVLQKLRDFQDLGHQIVIVIGDFTGMIGDPSGRSETRKPLTWEEIRANAETYRAQLGRVLDMARVRLEFNSTWLSPLSFEDIVRETAHVTVAQMLQREDFAARYGSGRPISLHEFLYPLAQAYDSVALRADVELGGTDQTFNLLLGRDLQRAHGREPQIAVIVPILEGLDGVQKMSKSLGNYVGISESPEEIYGKLMSISDDLMWRYFELLTRLPAGEIDALRAGHPRDAKMRLARMLTATYHGDALASRAEAKFVREVQRREVPVIIDQVTVALGVGGGGRGKAEADSESRPLWWVVKEAGLATSTSEGRRLIRQGAVDVDGVRVTDPDHPLHAGPGYLIRAGKRRYKRVVLQSGKKS